MARPLHQLTQKGVEFLWTGQCEGAFLSLKRKLTEAPVLAYPSLSQPFVLETDASGDGLGAVLSQVQSDGLRHPIAYASRGLSKAERNYGITELETLAVVWAVTHFRTYLYGNEVTVFTDHSAVNETPNPSGKHARWWIKVYESGLKQVNIMYRPGKSNLSADALSRSPVGNPSSSPLQEMMEEENACMIAAVQGTSSSELIGTIHEEAPGSELFEAQKRDPYIQEIQAFLKDGTIPADKKKARKLVFQAPLFTVLDKVLYFIDQTKDGAKRIFFPQAFDNTSWKNTTVGCMVDISVDPPHSANWHAIGGGKVCTVTFVHTVRPVPSASSALEEVPR